MADKNKPGKRTALGKGLGALLGDSSYDKESFSEIPEMASSVREISIDKIKTNPFQPRTDFDKQALEELAESIRVQGIIQPITVREQENHTFQLISGERRLQASKLAGLTSIPAYIRTANDQQMLEMALIENIHREDLNAIEIALSYQRLITECNLKQEDIGQRVSKDRSTVTNYLRLLKLPPDIQVAIKQKKISMGHARALINIENADVQLFVLKKILEQDLSVRSVESLVRSLGKKKTYKPQPKKDQDIIHLESKLSSHFGTKVELKGNGSKGSINIPYLSMDDLERILELLNVR